MLTVFISLDDNRKKSQKTKLDKFNLKYSDLDIINPNGEYIDIRCGEGHEYTIRRSLLYHRSELNIEPCTVCNPMNSKDSFHEK